MLLLLWQLTQYTYSASDGRIRYALLNRNETAPHGRPQSTAHQPLPLIHATPSAPGITTSIVNRFRQISPSPYR